MGQGKCPFSSHLNPTHEHDAFFLFDSPRWSIKIHISLVVTVAPRIVIIFNSHLCMPQTNTRRISCSEGTGIRQGCSPVAVSQTLRDEARYPRLLVYYIAKNQHDLAQSTIRTMLAHALIPNSCVFCLVSYAPH